jgi:hypothetical protein
MSLFRDEYAREQLTEVVNDALGGESNEQAERVLEAIVRQYGEPAIVHRTRGGTRMDSRWNEHRIEFPWQDGVL